MNASLFVGLLLFCTVPAASQSIAIKDINFRDGYLVDYDEKDFQLIYKIQSEKSLSNFRRIEFDTLLNVKDTTLIQVKGKYHLVASSKSAMYAGSVFGSTELGQLYVHFVHAQTDSQYHFIIKPQQAWYKKMAVRMIPTDDPSLFVMMYQLDKKSWGMKLVSPQGMQHWEKTIIKRHKFTIPYSTSFHDKLILVFNNRFNSNKLHYETAHFDLKTGEATEFFPIQKEKWKYTVDNFIIKDSTLYVGGRKFPGRKVDQSKTGIPYLYAYKQSGEAPEEIKISTALNSMKFIWLDVLYHKDGSRYMIGENFTSNSFGTYLSRAVVTGIATMGFLSVRWTSMKFHDVVIQPIQDERAPTPQRLQLTPRKVTIGGFMESYSFAQYAKYTGQVRYLGHDRTNNPLLLEGQRLKKFDLKSLQLTDLGELPLSYSHNVLFSSDSYIVLLNQRKLNNLVELKVFPLTQHGLVP